MHLFKKLRQEKAESLKTESEVSFYGCDSNHLGKVEKRFTKSFESPVNLESASQSFKYSKSFDLERFAVDGTDKFYYISDYLTTPQIEDLEYIIRN